jgi:hypothetical protein
MAEQRGRALKPFMADNDSDTPDSDTPDSNGPDRDGPAQPVTPGDRVRPGEPNVSRDHPR